MKITWLLLLFLGLPVVFGGDDGKDVTRIQGGDRPEGEPNRRVQRTSSFAKDPKAPGGVPLPRTRMEGGRGLTRRASSVGARGPGGQRGPQRGRRPQGAGAPRGPRQGMQNQGQGGASPGAPISSQGGASPGAPISKPVFDVSTSKGTVDGNSVDKIGIKGQPDADTKLINDVFERPSKASGDRPVFNTDDQVLVGDVDDKFVVYGNKEAPEKLLEMGDDGFKINTYSKIGKRTQEIDDDDENIKNKLKSLKAKLSAPPHLRKNDEIKAVGEELKDILNSGEGGENDDPASNKKRSVGKNYDIEYEDADGKGVQDISIKGRPQDTEAGTEFVDDSFDPPPPVKGERPISHSDDQLLIGGVDDNFLLYGNKGAPDKLVEMNDGKYKINTYSKLGKRSQDLDDDTARKIKENLKKLQAQIELPLNKRNVAEIEKSEKELIARMNSPGQDGTGGQGSRKHSIGEHYELDSDEEDDKGNSLAKIKINGRPTSKTKYVDDTFKPPKENDRPIMHSDDQVFVGGPDESFLLYGHKEVPEMLVEKDDDDKWKINTYTKIGKRSKDLDDDTSENFKEKLENLKDEINLPLDERHSDKRKGIEDDLNKLMRAHGDSEPDEASPKKQSKGKNYEVDFQREDDKGQSVDKIKIKGRPKSDTEYVEDTFTPATPRDGIRSISHSDDQLFVSDADEDFQVYGHDDAPTKLIVKQDGDYKINTYTDIGKRTTDLDEATSNDIAAKLKFLQDQIDLPPNQRNVDGIRENEKKLVRLMDSPGVGGADGGSDSGEQSTGQNFQVTTVRGDPTNPSDKIRIVGRPTADTKDIDDTFDASPSKQRERPISHSDDQVLVGDVDDDFLIYGHKDVPDTLIVKRNGEYKIKTYPDKREHPVNPTESKEIGDKLRDLKDEINKPLEGRTPGKLKKIEDDLKELMKTHGNKSDAESESESSSESQSKERSKQERGPSEPEPASPATPRGAPQDDEEVDEAALSKARENAAGMMGLYSSVGDAYSSRAHLPPPSTQDATKANTPPVAGPKAFDNEDTSKLVAKYVQDFHQHKVNYVTEEHELKMKAHNLQLQYWMLMQKFATEEHKEKLKAIQTCQLAHHAENALTPPP